MLRDNRFQLYNCKADKSCQASFKVYGQNYRGNIADVRIFRPELFQPTVQKDRGDNGKRISQEVAKLKISRTCAVCAGSFFAEKNSAR